MLKGFVRGGLGGLFLVLVVACGDDDQAVDPPDRDAGLGADSGSLDAGSAVDASAEGGPGDAGLDAGRTDAARPEGGLDASVDAGADASSGSADAGPPVMVGLAQASASASQVSYGVEEAIDGTTPGAPTEANGWAVDVAGTSSQTAVFETVSDTPAYGTGTRLVLTFFQTSVGQHLLGRFRVSVTTADRSMFADGLGNGGALGTASLWTVASSTTATATNGVTLGSQADGSLRASVSGATPQTSVYTVVFETPLDRLTGIRLEVLEDAMLPDAGPGLSSNGNFVLSELEMGVSARR